MMKSNALYIMLLAALTLGSCTTPHPKESESTESTEAYDGPERVDDEYEIPSGNPEEAAHIVVDKGLLTLKLYDKSNRLICKFPVAVGRIYGNKRCNGDLKTPEGDFKISGKIQDASEWKTTTAEGTERVKGGYGPWFIRLDVPDIASVGICGTLTPELVGTRSTSGNIVMYNEDLDSLRNMINQSISITIIPGERDLRADDNYVEPTPEESNDEQESNETATEPEKKSEEPKKVEETKKKEEPKKSENNATTDSNGDVWHTIAKGEYLSTIAEKYGTSVAKIKKLNPGLNVDKIREGQKIKIYGAEEATSTADNAKAKSTKTPGEVWHTVESGEYASKIVSKYGISLSDLKELNPGLNVDKIREGQKLRVK